MTMWRSPWPNLVAWAAVIVVAIGVSIASGEYHSYFRFYINVYLKGKLPAT